MARKYRVTVNGKAYDVDVEEMGAGVPAAAPAPAAAAGGVSGWRVPVRRSPAYSRGR